MDYVVGFMREALSDRVVMVRKNKPAWQHGLLNGVGGKVDHQVPVVPDNAAKVVASFTGQTIESVQQDTRLETPLEAMVREFKEETGIDTDPTEWRLVLYINDPRDFYTGGDGGTVYWFVCTRRFLPALPPRVLDSGEELLTVRIPDIAKRDDVLASPRWVLLMAFNDPTLAPLGHDADVMANARAASTVVRFDAKRFVADQVAKHRADLQGGVKDRLTKVAQRALSEDFRFVPKGVDDQGRPQWKIVMPTRVHEKDTPGFINTPDPDPVGCKIKFLHRDGAPLCGCPVDRCNGIGMSPDNLERALGPGFPWPANALELPTDANPNKIKLYGKVVNKARTESGIVVAIAGDAAWVQSEKYPLKRVTLYLKDLCHAGGDVGTVNGDKLIDTAHIPGKLARDGVVNVNGRQRVHNGVSLGRDLGPSHKGRSPQDGASGPVYADPGKAGQAMTPGTPGRTKPIDWSTEPRWRHTPVKTYDALTGAVARPVNVRSLGLDGHDKVVPGEPLERPDAAWAPGYDPNSEESAGGGAQEHFGGEVLSSVGQGSNRQWVRTPNPLPPMPEQRRSQICEAENACEQEEGA